MFQQNTFFDRARGTCGTCIKVKACRILYNQEPKIQTLILYIHCISLLGADESVGSDGCSMSLPTHDEVDGLVLYELKLDSEDRSGVLKKVCEVLLSCLSSLA